MKRKPILYVLLSTLYFLFFPPPLNSTWILGSSFFSRDNYSTIAFAYTGKSRRMRRPREPTPGECCGSGCTRCVWDIYYDELARFEEFIAGGGVEEEGTQSSEEEEVANYIGSVVVKYIDPPALSTTGSPGEWERAEMKGRGFFPIDRIELVRCSTSLFSPTDPGISVVNLFTSAKGRAMLPGDVVEVLVTNSHGTQDADDVERLCKALHLDPCAWCELHRSPFVPEDNFPPWLPLQKPLTLGQLLSAYVDISSSSYLLHQSFFENLFRIYSDSKPSSASSTSTTPSPDPEKVRLLEACASSETGPQLLRLLSKSSAPLCYPSLVDVLEVFSFVNIPLDRLLEVSGPLQTRRYSLANWLPATLPPSPLQLCMREVCARRSANLPAVTTVGADAQRVADMLNRVSQDASRDHGGFFFGHTSHPLCSAARSMTRSAAGAGQRGMYVSFSLFGNSSFAQQLQAGCTALCSPGQAKSLCSQLFLIGCGTGIAPLIAAVTQLMLRRASTAAGSAPFPCWVFYGARTKAELLYDETLKEALRTGAIAKYEYALSREEDNEKQGKYVTDLVKGNRLMVTDSLQSEGQLFVCGPAKALLSVRELVKCDLLAESDDDDSVQEQRLLVLENRGRLNFDIWSTGNIFE